jgi:hypothetical protein
MALIHLAMAVAFLTAHANGMKFPKKSNVFKFICERVLLQNSEVITTH